jgi:hypothetical protein
MSHNDIGLKMNKMTVGSTSVHNTFKFVISHSKWTISFESLGPLRLEKEGYSYLQNDWSRDHIDTSGSNTEAF